MLITAALLLNIKMMLNVVRNTPALTGETHGCHVRVVSHKFIGAPGTVFAYEGERFSIPRSGTIELIASRRGNSYELAGRKLPLNVFPVDEFGTETIRVDEAAGSSDSGQSIR